MSAHARLPMMRSLAAEAAWWRSEVRAHRVAVVAIAAMIVVGTALRANTIGSNPRVSKDEAAIVTDADSILDGKHYATLRWAPGTPLLFAASALASGRHWVEARPRSSGPAQRAQLLVEILTLVAVAMVAWRLAGRGAACLAVALTAFYEPLILTTRTYLSEPLGGLATLGLFVVACWARTRGIRAVAVAGVAAGIACLIREDLIPAVAVVAVAIAASAWRQSHGRAMTRGLVYLGAAILAVAPWAVAASNLDGRFVPITDGGPNALFVGTYLPAEGNLYETLKQFRPEVCRRLPQDCAHYSQLGSAPMFELIAQRYPHMSAAAAIDRAALDNLRKYGLGHPAAFAEMLLIKLWSMWGHPWGGGDSARMLTSTWQHYLFVGLAWIGLLGGAILTRRWSLITVTIGLATVTALNVLVITDGRHNLRLTPLLFTFGAAGAWFMLERLRAYIAIRRREPLASVG